MYFGLALRRGRLARDLPQAVVPSSKLSDERLLARGPLHRHGGIAEEVEEERLGEGVEFLEGGATLLA